MSFSFIDLFAGIGGFHAVLSAFGGEGRQAAEIDERAADVYETNWGFRPDRDVIDLAHDPAGKIQPHTVLAGGFPCQPFSKSGRQLGMAEERGQLVTHLLKILEEHHPPVVILENVRNIAGPRQLATWTSVIDGLRKTGYRVPSAPCVFSPHLLPPERGGAPQIRDRVYILGTYVGLERALHETAVEPAVRRAPVDGWDPQNWDLTQYLVADSRITRRVDYNLTVEENHWIDVWNDLLRRLGRAEVTGGFPLWSSYWRDGAEVDASAPDWKQTFERKNIAFYEANRQVIREWLAANPDLREFPASRQKLEWQAGPLRPEDGPVRSLDRCLLHFRPSGIRAKRPTYTPALVAMTQTSVYGPKRRRLVPEEAARLQGFPEWFDFCGQPDRLTYKQLGNAINVGAAYHVFREHVLRDAEDIVAADPDEGARLVKAVREAPLAPDVPQPLTAAQPQAVTGL